MILLYLTAIVHRAAAIPCRLNKFPLFPLSHRNRLDNMCASISAHCTNNSFGRSEARILITKQICSNFSKHKSQMVTGKSLPSPSPPPQFSRKRVSDFIQDIVHYIVRTMPLPTLALEEQHIESQERVSQYLYVPCMSSDAHSFSLHVIRCKIL